MDDVVQGYPSVGLSITNPDVSRDKALDRNEPFTFLEFVNATKEIFQPDTLEKFYNHYIKEWNKENKGKRGEDNEIIVIVSAMAGVTNDLTEKSNLISKNFNSKELDVLLASGEQVS